MNERICFIGDGNSCLWQLPYIPAPGEELVVSLIADGALERRLASGRDYSLMGNCVFCSLPAGARLYVTRLSQDGSQTAQASPLSAQAAQTLAFASQAAAPVYEGASSLTQEEAGDALERRYNELVSRMRLELEQRQAALLEGIQSTFQAQLNAFSLLVKKEERQLRDSAQLYKGSLPQRQGLVLPKGAPAGSYLTLPVSYLVGGRNLQLFLDGVLANPEADYEECGAVNERSSTIRILRDLEPVAHLDCLAASLSSTDSALRAAEDASRAQQAAAVLLSEARSVSTASQASVAAAARDTTAAQGWANAAQKSAEAAYQASVNAYDAAAQISLYRREPGISAVKEIADIHACSPGLFIINPHLTHAPTPFFGVWPASCIHEMNWDGVFFLGGKCYPADPALPPAKPPRPRPDPMPAAGSADEWIPCDHTHQEAPDPEACNCQSCWQYAK